MNGPTNTQLFYGMGCYQAWPGYQSSEDLVLSFRLYFIEIVLLNVAWGYITYQPFGIKSSNHFKWFFSA